MKLHLGCGEKYLNGYINIDFPAVKHSVQKHSVADRPIDITKLKYPAGSIEEIRLHHVFEHFTRAITCALLATWYIWLKEGGLLRIEVPDFNKMSKNYNNRSQRHIFGSQEASWAIHFAGYTSKNLTNLLERYGFIVEKIKRNSWKGTANIEIFAVRQKRKMNLEEFEKITRKYLGEFLVDNSGGERRLLKVWMKNYNDQIKK